MLTSYGALHLPLPSVLPIRYSGTRPDGLGAQIGRLLPYPSSLNCASIQAPDEGHWIAPLPYTGPARDAWSRLRGIIASLPRTKVIAESGTYLHVEFTSLIFRFVDDVEFIADDVAKVIHVRSASRVGHSALGVNQRRIETVLAQWQSRPPLHEDHPVPRRDRPICQNFRWGVLRVCRLYYCIMHQTASVR